LSKHPKISRSNLRDDARSAIIELVLSGNVEPGGRLNETHLSQQLGISPTPIREALISLESESFLVFARGRGFSVRELSIDEVEDTYPVMALLESFALQLAGTFSDEQIARLSTLNQKFKNAKSPEAAAKADRAWHECLINQCPNHFLLSQIESVRRATYRYELAFMRAQKTLNKSVAQHEEIIRALANGRTRDARNGLEKNCQNTMEPIKEWISNAKSDKP